MSEKLVLSRANHTYIMERVTPMEEIPEEFARIQCNGQVTDVRLCYNWEPGADGGSYVECGSVNVNAAKEGFVSLEEG